MPNLYQNPKFLTTIHKGLVLENAPNLTDVQEQLNFDEFFEEVYMEIEQEYGHIQEMNVCQNFGEHLNGNVYVKFYKQMDADQAFVSLNKRWFNKRPIYAEYSPVEDFYFACCLDFDRGECERGDFCNFMHLKPISKELRRKLATVPIRLRLRDGGRSRRKKGRSSKHHIRTRYHSSSSPSSKRPSSKSNRSDSSSDSRYSSGRSDRSSPRSRGRSSSRSVPRECLRD